MISLLHQRVRHLIGQDYQDADPAHWLCASFTGIRESLNWLKNRIWWVTHIEISKGICFLVTGSCHRYNTHSSFKLQVACGLRSSFFCFCFFTDLCAKPAEAGLRLGNIWHEALSGNVRGHCPLGAAFSLIRQPISTIKIDCTSFLRL